MKERLGQEIASRVSDGDIIGIGTGSTVDAAISAIGARVSRDRIQVSCFTTSIQSARKCEEAGIQVLDSRTGGEISWGFDGADAADRRLRAIKGGGGALLMEKIIATRCREFVLIIDESKFVENIASHFPVPIEILPDAQRLVEAGLASLGAIEVALRRSSNQYGPVITARGNVILDARFTSISDSLERDIKVLTGVVESGLFLGQATELLVATPSEIHAYRRS